MTNESKGNEYLAGTKFMNRRESLKISNRVTLLLLTIALSAMFGLTQNVLADSSKDITEQMQEPLANVSLPDIDDDPGRIEEIVGKIIGVFLSIFGVIFMVLVIYGGYKWMMASGREEEIKKAKDTIRSAIIGLIIVIAAYAITYFITSALESAVQ